MCKLRSHLHAPVETGQHRTLSVQRLWLVPQDERPEQTAHQTQTQAGESSTLSVQKPTLLCVRVLREGVHKESVR